MLPVRPLSPEELLAVTASARPPRSDLRRYRGHPFQCACGLRHAFRRDAGALLREAEGRRLVLGCPAGRPYLTWVEPVGILRFRGFRSVFGAELVPSAAQPYARLGVSAAAPDAEVRTAWLDLVRVWHPDRFEDDPRLRARAERELCEVNAAFQAIQALRGRPLRKAPRSDPGPRGAVPRAGAGELPLSKFRQRLRLP